MLETNIKCHQERESEFYRKQTSSSEHVSQCIDDLFRQLRGVSDEEVQIKSKLEKMIDQNGKISQQVEYLGTNQNSCLSSISDVHQLLHVLKASYKALETSLRHVSSLQMGQDTMNLSSQSTNSSVNETCFNCPQPMPPFSRFVCGNMNSNGGELNVSRQSAVASASSIHLHDVGNNFAAKQHQHHRSVSLPSRPLSHFSPQPFNSRHFHYAGGKPSPTAVVLPIVQKDSMKDENLVRKDCEIASNPIDIFESSGSESGQEIEIVLERRACKQTVDRKKCKIAEPKIPVTPPGISNPSTPIQRSIRRYGKIKKNGCDADKEFNRKAKTLDGDRGQSDSRSLKCPPSKSSKLPSNTTSRGTLALKRKQGNVFNFASDDDLKHITDLLQTTQKNRRVRIS